MRAPRQLLGTARRCLARHLEMSSVRADPRLPGCSKGSVSLHTCSDRSGSYTSSPWKMKVAPRAGANARSSLPQRLPFSLRNAHRPARSAASPLSFKTVQQQYSQVVPQDRSVNRYRTLMTNSSIKEGRSRTLRALIRSNSAKAVQLPRRTLSKGTSDSSSLLDAIKYGSTWKPYLRSTGARGMGITQRPGDRAGEHGQRMPLAKPDSSPEAVKAREREEFVRARREQLVADIDEVEKPFRDATETGNDLAMGQPSTPASTTRTADAPAATTGTEPEEESASELHEVKQEEGTGALLDHTELVAAGTPEPWVNLENVVFSPELVESTDEALERGLELYELRRGDWEEAEDIIVSALRRAKLT